MRLLLSEIISLLMILTKGVNAVLEEWVRFDDECSPQHQ